MNHILRDASPASLATAIEANVFSLFPEFQKWPRAEVHDEPELIWSMTDIPFPLFNSIMRAHLKPERIDATVRSLITRAKERHVPVLWWTGPTTQPADLGTYLEQQGFISLGQALGMAVELAHLRTDLPTPSGFSVQIAQDAETLKQWGHIFAQGFEMPDFVGEAFCDFMGYADPATMRAYLGWLDGQPVATSLLVLAAGVAGIYNVATLPEARRKGIGTFMTTAPLRDAQAMGYAIGILHASEMGDGIYRSLGFQEYCYIHQYMWSSDEGDAG